tara:strand:+ start:8912 stop:9940 length:1029 start_codon:yes stop_codon:yes gene_type:complete
LLPLLWIQLIAAAILILIASKYLVTSSDTIAIKIGLGHTFVGIVLLATATSLPELATGISSITLANAPDLAAGAAFGSNIVNLLIIAIADIIWRKGPMLASISRAPVIVAILGIVIIFIASISTAIHHWTNLLDNWYVSPLSIVLVFFFIVATYIVYQIDKKEAKLDDTKNTNESVKSKLDNETKRAFLFYMISAICIIGASIWLSEIGDRLADALNWEQSFVGTQFLAISTSLPELATTVAALRLGNPEMAVANLLGSNLFNMGFILFADELAVTGSSLWANISFSHVITGLTAILMTLIIVSALLIRQNHPKGFSSRWINIESSSLLIIYIIASIGIFYL